MSGDVDTVGLIENIQSEVICEVGISDLLIRSQAYFNYMLDFFASNLDYEDVTPGTLRITSSTSIWQ